MGRGKCSAGACPPLPAHRQPTLIPRHRREDPPFAGPIFVSWCAGERRHERLVRKQAGEPNAANASIPFTPLRGEPEQSPAQELGTLDDQ